MASSRFSGSVLEIYTCGTPRGAMRQVDSIEVVAGNGLVGDRYSAEVSRKPTDGSREVTLIESEALEAIVREDGIELPPGASRRNLVTRGVPLNHLVGCEFRVGQEVVLRGTLLCEPCSHLEGQTVPGIRKALVHRGGLCTQIVRGGVIRAGDVVEPI
jgi:MOSC domain-containing protein YiiM